MPGEKPTPAGDNPPDHWPDITVPRLQAVVLIRRMEALREALAHGDQHLIPFAWQSTYELLVKLLQPGKDDVEMRSDT